MPAKKHHYVPVFYQKGFADTDNMLWVYDRKLQRYKQLHPIVVCRSEDLYTVRQEGGTNDRRIETDILSPIESAAAPVVRKLAPGVTRNPVELVALMMFISLQYTRLTSFGRAVSSLVEMTGNEMMQMQFGTLERARRTLANYEREMGAPLTDDAAGMVEAVNSGHVRAHANETGFLRYMFEIASTLESWLEQADWTVLTAPKTSGFIVCDHPFVTVPKQGTVPDGVGYGIPGTTCYFPLTRDICLMFRQGDEGFRHRRLDSREVRTINHNVAANSDRFVMGSDLTQLEAVVKKSGCEGLETGERFSIEIIEENEDSRYTKFTNLPRRYFY